MVVISFIYTFIYILLRVKLIIQVSAKRKKKGIIESYGFQIQIKSQSQTYAHVFAGPMQSAVLDINTVMHTKYYFKKTQLNICNRLQLAKSSK